MKTPSVDSRPHHAPGMALVSLTIPIMSFHLRIFLPQNPLPICGSQVFKYCWLKKKEDLLVHESKFFSELKSTLF